MGAMSGPAGGWTRSVRDLLYVAIAVFHAALQQPHRARRPDRRQRLDQCELQGPVAHFEQIRHPINGALQLEPSCKLDHLELRRGIVTRQRAQHFVGIRLGETLGRRLHQLAHTGVREARHPPHQREQGRGSQLGEQLREIFFTRMDRRFVQ